MDAPLATIGWVAVSAVKAALGDRRVAAPTDGTDLDPWLNGALGWLARSQDAHTSGGSAKAWHLVRGWLPPYPETSGYIVPTLYDVATVRGDRGWAERALRMARWELGVQLPDGAWPGDHVGVAPKPIVFNTGQVMFGMLRAHAETGDVVFFDAAKRAGDFLERIQDPDGAWRTHVFADIPHAYHARVAWPLLILGKVTGDERYTQVGRRNLHWVVSKQNDTGWFAENIFRPGTLPNTHGIAYVTQSLVEAGAIDGNDAWIDAATRGVEPLVDKLDRRGFIAGCHDERYGDAAGWECVTGNVQAAITLLRLFQLRGNRKHLDGALRIITHVQHSIALDHPNPGIRGAIPGSWPLFGRYAPVQYPNWATKFWVDALLLAMALIRRERGEDLGSLAIVLAGRCSG